MCTVGLSDLGIDGWEVGEITEGNRKAEGVIWRSKRTRTCTSRQILPT
jgi:hypothetical protein